MNLIEGKVEWCGNGVVVIKERSVAQLVWQISTQLVLSICKQIERLLKLSIKGLAFLSLSGKLTVVAKKGLINLFMQVNGAEGIHPDSFSARQRKVKTPSVKSEPVSTKARMESPRPTGTLTEIRRYTKANLVTGNTCDEHREEQGGLQQLLPALAGFCNDRWLVLVSPTVRPDVAELTAAGIDPSRVLLVHARDVNSLGCKGLSIVEQALQSGTCGAVVAWLEECDAPALERLRQAAQVGQAWGVMFREGETLSAPSAVKSA